MWLSEKTAPDGGRMKRGTRNLVRLAMPFAAALLLAGCFQPMYASTSHTGGPGLRSALSGVEVSEVKTARGSSEARLGVEIRNALLFDFTGGGSQPAPTHKLTLSLYSNRQSVIVDLTSARSDVEEYALNATYSLTEIATGKVVATGRAFSRVSYDTPGQTQRFARIRGLRDAESRAGKVIADQIRNRLASYFVAGS
jgi:LPS-assembly lipoprotein